MVLASAGVGATPVLAMLHALAAERSYQPDPLEAPGPGNTYLCCSRPQTDVVLDL